MVTQRFYCERELETEQNCNIVTPTLMAITVFLSRSPRPLNRGPTLLGAGFLYRILPPTDWTSCALSYIIVQHPPSSCGRHKSHSFNLSTVKVIFWYSSTGCTCYLHRCISYFNSPAGSEVNIQHFAKPDSFLNKAEKNKLLRKSKQGSLVVPLTPSLFSFSLSLSLSLSFSL